MSRLLSLAVIAIAALSLMGCSGRGASALAGAPRDPAPTTPAELASRLNTELARLRVDPAKAAAKAPGPGNAVFDLRAVVQDPDGVGPLPPTGCPASHRWPCNSMPRRPAIPTEAS